MKKRIPKGVRFFVMKEENNEKNEKTKSKQRSYFVEYGFKAEQNKSVKTEVRKDGYHSVKTFPLFCKV